jgi:hypothetical protein
MTHATTEQTTPVRVAVSPLPRPSVCACTGGLPVGEPGGARLLAVAEQGADHAEHLEERNRVEDELRVVAQSLEQRIVGGRQRLVRAPAHRRTRRSRRWRRR